MLLTKHQKIKPIGLLIMLLLYSLVILAQETFEIKISTENNETLYKGAQHPTGSYFFAGRKVTYDGYRAYIVKVTKYGNLQELNIDEGDTTGYFHTFEFLDNGNILFIGQCYISDTLMDFDRLWLYEVDTNLNLVQEKLYYMLKDDYFGYQNWYSCFDSSNNIVIAGELEYYPSHLDMCFSKISQTCG